jgi:Carboxysome Shell Carbonic Anhydrase
MKIRKKNDTSNALTVREKAMTTTDLTPSAISADSKIVRALPIRQRIGWLINHAHRHAMAFQSPESFLARNFYMAQHPTSLVSFKCMDGRMNLSLATGTPPGIITPFRNLGGRFDMGWPYFGEVLAEHVESMVKQGRRTMVLITYHYSKGDPHRGCAGFNYDVGAARSHTFDLKRQVESVFGDNHSIVYPLVCGFETDGDALVLHGNGGEELDLSTLSDEDHQTLPAALARLYPDMPDQMSRDLLPLVQGNIAHISKIQYSNRSLDIEHHEWVIGIGRGFDWMYTPNLALIIGPYSPDLADPIRKAAGIITANMNTHRIPDDGFLLLAESPYQEVGSDRARAILRSCFLSKFAAEIIRTEFPSLKAKLHVRSAVIAWQTRVIELIDCDAA